ncbi:MAG: phosphatidylserine decarboxylase [archaeon]
MVWVTIVLIVLAILFLLIVLFLLFYKFHFLRNPARKITLGNNVVSPADGKVMMIKKYSKNKVDIPKGFLGTVKSFTGDVAKEGFIISIFMSPLDVHFNRVPISGVVKYVKRSKGKFWNAGKLEATFENENVQSLIEDGSFRIKVIQIAGFVARRIVPFIKGKEKVLKGQRMGLIKLGSQVTLILPASVKVKVQMGEKVVAGETIIAER